MKAMMLSALAAILSLSSTSSFALAPSNEAAPVSELLVVVEVLNENDPGLTQDQMATLDEQGYVEVSAEQYASRHGKIHHHGTGESFAARISSDSGGGSGHSFSGMASYYGNDAGSRTASGQRFNENAMTAAHRTLPFGTKLRVTYGGRSVVVTVNDRGPFVRGRVLDLSKGAARAIGMTGAGVGRVTAEVL